MLGNALGMFLAFAVLLTYFSPRSVRRIVGYGLLLDIAVWAVLLSVFSGTGAERLAGIGASLGITAAIHLYRWSFGYERLVRDGLRFRWARFAGRFT